MRRSNRPSSGYSAAAPPGHHQPRSSHLDIPSSHDDEPTNKLHKGSTYKANKAKILVTTALCGLVALATLIYAAKLVTGNNGGGMLFNLLNLKSAKFSGIHHKHKSHHNLEQHASSASLSQQHILPPDSIYRSTMTDIHGLTQDLIQYTGSISLIVNVACEWGLTSRNYQELSILYDKYKSDGFVVLAFPSNDYHQEKETDREILDYVQTNFPQVTFPIFAKSDLGSNAVFRMCQRHTGEEPEWNFHKYLVNGEGRAVQSFGHRVNPLEIEDDIVKLIREKKNHVVPQTF